MKNTAKKVVIELNLPEFSKKDVKVKIGKQGLEVKAEKKHEARVKRKGYFHEEKSYRAFSYQTSLPEIEPKKAKIEFEKGKLRITAPKK